MQFIVSPPWIISQHSDDDITAIIDVIAGPGGLVTRRKLGRGDQISILAEENLKLTALMFKTMEYCFKPYYVDCVNSRRVLEY